MTPNHLPTISHHSIADRLCWASPSSLGVSPGRADRSSGVKRNYQKKKRPYGNPFPPTWTVQSSLDAIETTPGGITPLNCFPMPPRGSEKTSNIIYRLVKNNNIRYKSVVKSVGDSVDERLTCNSKGRRFESP